MSSGLKNAKWWDSGEFRPKFTTITYEEQPPYYVQIRTNLVLTTVPVVTSIELGDDVTFKATLSLEGVALVGLDVLLEESVDGVWTLVGTDITDVNGETTYLVTPTQTTVYRARFEGT